LCSTQVHLEKQSKNKATGDDSISAECIQSLGDKGIQAITRLMNKIYNTGNIPDDFLKTVFITILKVNHAQECTDFRTISLMSNTSKILLHLINQWITPIIYQHMSDIKMGFRKGRGTSDVIIQFRTTMERSMQVNKKGICILCRLQKSI